MYTFSYLCGALALSPFWIYFYIKRPDLRYAMLRVSIIYAISGPISQYIYTIDWWRPETITGTKAGIEDSIFGFFYAGAVAVCYEFFFNTTYAVPQHRPAWPINFKLLGLIVASILFANSLVFSQHSFIGTLLSFGSLAIYIVLVRRDMIPSALIGALFSTFLGMIFFGFPELLTPGWIQATWLVENLSGYYVAYMPIEDFVWYIVVGAAIAPIFKFSSNLSSVRRPVADASQG